ncbi:hypothetical protein DIS24_g8055 [Lasiodiplodia hormozganensis]|uniref:Uncharacterized protein n=1 Tax=Lasiodiplodia hormozganensis TaxID=869390 RepID=A0AA40CNM4_9PEZI|nr:hypothetical protein DIS24_g8055 [Lasiodiplodia hormozganensis]
MDDLFQAMEDRSLGGPIFDARFEIEWDLLGFLRRQKYDAALEIAVERAITLTGSAKNAQAMTCLDYMSQTWPVIGEEIVKVLQKALKATSLSCKTRLSDGTELEISLQSAKAKILARGSRAALTELCEQFAWLGAALGPSPEDTSQPSTVWLATPVVSAFNSGELHTNPPSITVRIRFSTRSIPNGSLAHGACWHALFHHPVVVNGFPIRSRRNGERGLEASTALMGALAEARYVSQYAETLVLKGFCSMLVPTAHTETSITWHYVYNKDLSWLPYSGFRRECPEVVANDVLDSDMLNAGNKRNFVGWASSISRNLGTETALYQEIRPAGAPESSTRVASEKKLTISVSKLFGTSDSFVRGQRDKSIISSSASYTGQVYAARRIPVLLYDVATKRGWLVDGASALLHIARSQVEHPPFRDVSHFNDRAVNKRISFKHPDARGGPEAASHTLTDEDNQRHIIIREFDRYEEDTKGKPKEKMSYRCFKDIVSATWDTFDKIYSAQDELKKSAKQQLKNPFQKGIEGYEFMGIVSPHGPLTRRKVNLHTNGAEWSEFVARINAITLFGRNFGEIYEPTAEANLCSPWRTVPVDQEYLTVPVSLLKELKEYTWEDGKIEEDSPELVKHVLWTPSEDAFKQCGGKTDECTREPDDHVQQLTKVSRTASGFFEIARQKGSAHEEDYLPMKNGAVIFGKSSRLIHSRPTNSGYDSSQAGSLHTEAAERNGSSSMMAFAHAGIRSTSTFQERDDDETSGMSSPRAMSPLSGGERPFTGLESSRIGSLPASSEASASEPTLASQTAQQSPAPAATRKRTHRKALKLREALLKFRTWKQKIRPRATVK